ncbi:MAG: 5-methyltetrahydropteroyltriglutamate--homocysteine S-methyltransferase, partial [Candidatus Rokuibacteriota bacterium]
MTTAPLCRADHVGSLLRPRALKDAYQARAAGRLDAAGFEGALDDAVREVIRRQEAAGLGAVTDGELRRRSWFAGFVDAVEGLVHRDTHFAFIEDGEARLSVPVPHTAGPIRRVRGIATHELAFARSVATRPVKVTLPAPSVIHFFRGPEGIDRGVYPDEDAYWRDLLAAYRAEVEALGRLGCPYLQLDEVPIALLCDARIQARVAEWGWDWRALLARYV